jgi:hypothetical protein
MRRFLIPRSRSGENEEHPPFQRRTLCNLQLRDGRKFSHCKVAKGDAGKSITDEEVEENLCCARKALPPRKKPATTDGQLGKHASANSSIKS